MKGERRGGEKERGKGKREGGGNGKGREWTPQGFCEMTPLYISYVGNV